MPNFIAGAQAQRDGEVAGRGRRGAHGAKAASDGGMRSSQESSQSRGRREGAPTSVAHVRSARKQSSVLRRCHGPRGHLTQSSDVLLWTCRGRGAIQGQLGRLSAGGTDVGSAQNNVSQVARRTRRAELATASKLSVARSIALRLMTVGWTGLHGLSFPPVVGATDSSRRWAPETRRPRHAPIR